MASFLPTRPVGPALRLALDARSEHELPSDTDLQMIAHLE
jgi:hypothetical protein